MIVTQGMTANLSWKERKVSISTREIVAAIGAVVVLVTFCLVILYEVVNGKPITIPDALIALVSLITGVYYGQHAATNGAYAAGQVAQAKVASTTGTGDTKLSQPGS